MMFLDMAKRVLSTWIPESLAERVDRLIQSGEYVNTSDFLRQLIREKLKEEKTD